MSKQLILITAPFNCGHCARAIKELPPICEKHGFEFIEMQNSKEINLLFAHTSYKTIRLTDSHH